MNEEVYIMHSSDKAILLTSKRIIIDDGERRHEIMLEDYTSYAFKRKNIGNFGLLANIFAMLTILLLLGIWNDNNSLFKKPGQLSVWLIFFNSGYTIPFLVCGFLFLVSMLYYLLGRRCFLKLNGKYNSVSVQVRYPRNKSIKRFLRAVERQAEIVNQHA